MSERWRKRALLMSVLVGTFSIVGLGVTAVYCKTIWSGLMEAAWPLTALGIMTGFGAMFAIHRGQMGMATILSASAVVLVLVAWSVAQVYSGHYLGVQYAGPDPKTANVRALLLAGMILGLLLITPPMIWLFRIFKAEQAMASQADTDTH